MGKILAISSLVDKSLDINEDGYGILIVTACLEVLHSIWILKLYSMKTDNRLL